MSERSGKADAVMDRVERLQRRRVRVMWIQVILFLGWQASYLVMRPDPDAVLRPVDQVSLAAFLLWGAALVFLLASGGGMLAGAAVRDIANDEVTRDNRRSAFVWGYGALVLAGFALYLTSLFTRLAVLDVLQLLLSASVAVPMLRFVWLERRAG